MITARHFLFLLAERGLREIVVTQDHRRTITRLFIQNALLVYALLAERGLRETIVTAYGKFVL